jgi:hypothetical protein
VGDAGADGLAEIVTEAFAHTLAKAMDDAVSEYLDDVLEDSIDKVMDANIVEQAGLVVNDVADYGKKNQQIHQNLSKKKVFNVNISLKKFLVASVLFE